MNWDDIRLFLALSRGGSARAAATAEQISHTTVTRRAERLESNLGTRLFDRDVTGYRLTGAGETLLKAAEKAEDALLSVERRIKGQDSQLSGIIRITTSELIASRLLMPGLAEFNRGYPEIELEILLSGDIFDLARREADIAIRFMGGGRLPAEDLVGRRLMAASTCYYASPDYLLAHDPNQPSTTARWIGWDDDEPFPSWVKRSPFPHVAVRGKFNDHGLQVEAALAGMGITALPCFLGDSTPGLQRIPGCEPVDNYHIWLLSHPDLREAARMRACRQFLVELFEQQRDLLTGQRPRPAA